MNITLEADQGKTLVVDGDAIRILKKPSFFSEARDKSISIRHITSVEVKKPSTFVGFIQFSLAGGTPKNSSYTVTGGAMDAVKDENAVVFMGEDKYQTALKIKTYIDSWSDATRASLNPDKANSFVDEIRKLKNLLDDGVISQEDFERGKNKLLE